MKNICFLIGNIGLTGGTERVSTLLANYLSQKSYKVSILSVLKAQNSAFNIYSEVKVDYLFHQSRSMIVNFIPYVFKLRSYIKNNNIDTLIVVDSISCIFSIPALIGLKTNHICWEHFNLDVTLGSKYRGIARLLATKYCDHIVVLTKTDKNNWKRYYKSINAKLHTIYNPNPFSDSQKKDLKSKNILYVGRLSSEKGCDLLLQAWSKVSHEKSDYRLKIIGDGDEKNNLIELSKKLNLQDNVEFKGFSNSLIDEYRNAKLLCLPSRYEGFGMVIVEANTFGLPVISFDIETGPQELIDNNINGYKVPAFDIDILKEKIIEFMELSDENYMVVSEKCKDSVKKFNIDEIFSNWREII